MEEIKIKKNNNPPETSRNAYSNLSDDGGLERQIDFVYDVLRKHGPATAYELYEKHPVKTKTGHSNVSMFHRRLSDLHDQGLAIKVKDRECSVTHSVVTEWQFIPKDDAKPILKIDIKDMLKLASEALKRIRDKEEHFCCYNIAVDALRQLKKGVRDD